MLETTWFVLWGLLWTVYFVLDGFDLGLGMLLRFVAKTDMERRVVYNAMGPFWDGNEVWLITAGGVTFAAFPKVYATLFSSFYLPLLLLLFGLIIRGIAFEFRSKEDDPSWHSTWDACMLLGSLITTLLLGVAFANLFRGVFYDMNGDYNGDISDLLNPYGILGGVVFIILFLLHGAHWLAFKTTGEIHDRAVRAAKILWPVAVGGAVAFLIASKIVTPLYNNFLDHPVLFIFPLLAVAGLVLAFLSQRSQSYFKAWVGSALTIAGASSFGIAGLFPNMFPSLYDREKYSLTCFNSASSPLTLKIMLGVAVVLVPIVIAYQTWVYIKFSGKVRPEDFEHDQAY